MTTNRRPAALAAVFAGVGTTFIAVGSANDAHHTLLWTAGVFFLLAATVSLYRAANA